MMTKYLDWLRNEERGVALLRSMFATVGITIVWIIMVVKFTLISGYDVFDTPTQGAIASMKATDFLDQFVGVSGEEAIFRLLPLGLIITRFGVGLPLLVSAVCISTLFGLLHGGPEHIALQGVFGLFLSLLFIKSCAVSRDYVKAMAVVILVHFTTNMVIMSLPEIRL